jgi:dTDP-glucose 4,6-dehydratase
VTAVASTPVRIFLTGGAGFIGSHFVRNVLTGRSAGLEDANLTVLDALSYSGNRDNLTPVASDPRLTFVEGDITDAGLVEDLMPGHDAVVHFAAETHVDRSILDGTSFVSTNVLGTQVLLEAARRHGVGRFLHVSTDEVYGSIEEGSWTEDQPLAPRSPYAASKAASDLMALAFFRTHGFDIVLTRCSNTYGPYQFPEKLIPLFVTNILDGGTVPLYGDGLNIRDWLHVDDHCLGIALVLGRGRAGEVYHVGGGTELTNRELTEKLLVACGADWDRVAPVEDRQGHDRRYSLDISKIAAELGYAPRVNFDNGVADTVAWYRNNRAWWEPLKSRRRASHAQGSVG